MNTQHTPTPWFVDGVEIFIPDPDNDLGGTSVANAKTAEDAAFIVRACNGYDEAIDVLRMISDSGVALAEPIEKAMCATLAKAGAL